MRLVSEREKTKGVTYEALYEESQNGIRSSNTDWIHGSILVLGEMMLLTGDYMQSHFKNVCEAVLKFRTHKEKEVRKAVIALIPLLAEYSPPLFGKGYLSTCMTHLLEALRVNQERSECFIALGKVAMAVGTKIKPYVKNVLSMVNLGLASGNAVSVGGKQDKKGLASFCPEALTCIAMFAKGLPNDMTPHMPEILPQMMNTGLSSTLVEALTELSVNIPSLLPSIQIRLLDVLSMVLSNKPFRAPSSQKQKTIRGEDNAFEFNVQVYNIQQDADPKLIALALKTLGSFDFTPHVLTEMVRESIVNYLDDDNPTIRAEAAKTCTKLIVKPGQTALAVGHGAATVAEVLEKLLIVGIADPDSDIRFTVLSSIDERYDHHLAQADNLRSLFVALNDEVFRIRELVINIIGRLSILNPAHVMPSLRKTLIVLLTELEFSGDSQVKEESALLLGHLIRSSQKLVEPYVDTILRALLPKLRDSSARVATCVLSALGELARVSGSAMLPHVDQLLPLIIETLQDQSSSSKREVALRTLGQLASSTGYVIDPLIKHPKLLEILLQEVLTEQIPSIRMEILKVMGIMGALDPYKHKINKSDQVKDGNMAAIVDPAGDLSPSHDSYYPTVAISSLMRILFNPSLSTHHSHVIQAVVFMAKSLDKQSIQFLPQVMPAFLHVLSTCEPGFREFLLQQLGRLVGIVKQHIRDYLDDIFALVKKHWDDTLIIPIITLVEEISVALSDEFKVYLPELIPSLLLILHTDRTEHRRHVQKVLHALEVFNTTVDDYLHLIVPAVVRLFEQVDVPMTVRALAIQTLGRLCDKLNFRDHASRIIHPIARVLRKEDLKPLHVDAMNTLCELVFQLGSDYCIFIISVAKILSQSKIVYEPYENLVATLLRNQPLSAEIISQVRQRSRSGLFVRDGQDKKDSASADSTNKRLKLNERNLQAAWECAEVASADDWFEWMRNFSQELIRESPSPALRSCLALAQVYYPLARDLFNAAFYSCWVELNQAYKTKLVLSLETSLLSDSIPPEILQQLLNLAEFMEHDDNQLPIDIRTFGVLAAKCRAFAKALHYKEIEFSQGQPEKTIEALISINNQLQQPQAAVGILLYAQQTHRVQIKESWYEKLGRWDEALDSYSNSKDTSLSRELGKMRCYNALGEWDLLADLSAELWSKHETEEGTLAKIAPLAAAASWNLGKWDKMARYVNILKDDVQGTFFRAILSIQNDKLQEAEKYILMCRGMVDSELTALVGESYTRAYDVVCKVQQLSELEEIIRCKKERNIDDVVLLAWKRRLMGCKRNVEVWQKILSVRSLMLPPREDYRTWLKFASLCRKAGRLRLSIHTLNTLLPEENMNAPLQERLQAAAPEVQFGFIQQMWSQGEKKEASQQLRALTSNIKAKPEFLARCHLRMTQWLIAGQGHSIKDSVNEGKLLQEELAHCQKATQLDPEWYKAWHLWGLVNYDLVLHYEQNRASRRDKIKAHLLPSINGFFKSIALAPDRALQDTLRVLQLWFKFGNEENVEAALAEGFATVSIDNWLQVIPQIIARIHSPVAAVRRLIKELLCNVGKAHPQALVYPLTVASKSTNPVRRQAANEVIEHMKQHSPLLVEQSLLVSNELIRVAIVWHEMWHEGLEEASRVYFGDNNVDAMFALLSPLHEMLEAGAKTLQEVQFAQAFGADLAEAWEWCTRYLKTKRQGDLNQAWDLYYHVFRKIAKQLPLMRTFDLQYVSPELLNCKGLELAVPGTYEAGQETIVRIQSFQPSLRVISSKQRPRKLAMTGNDGRMYEFLLKGHEDLRQDERVMQLFALINTLLAMDPVTAKHHLRISRYAVVPLSPNSGVIGWLGDTDTLHDLIKGYRESRGMPLSGEHKILSKTVQNFDNLVLIQKVQLFQKALDQSDGKDLERVLWLKSRNSEVWLERRTNYTRSLALMSMVGYILGLGDRHPSNLMLERPSGKIIHIDFGN